MAAGKVLFMLDGLDETEPELRDRFVLPWLSKLVQNYPNCIYLLSSRPVGYPPGRLQELGFTECDLMDFTEPQVAEYTRHWCTAVRLAQNESDEEAHREGEKDGEQIVAGFRDNPYIRNLACNPLMLSAVCLVNFFERGQLPQDRAVLYRLCVEGLLHNWDQRRGIHSELGIEEKLRVCREVALAMQAKDQAEYTAAEVLEVFNKVLPDKERAQRLLEHVRYRTGLLLERRAGIFAFAHLTFQEYLAASAVHEGNLLGILPEKLVQDHSDPRWQEVIALYCGLTTTPSARSVVEGLIALEDSPMLGEVLAEAYLSSGPELTQDTEMERNVVTRIAVAPYRAFIGVFPGEALDRFPHNLAAQIANSCLGMEESNTLSQAFSWLLSNKSFVDIKLILEKLNTYRALDTTQISELIYFIYWLGSDEDLMVVSSMEHLYGSAPLDLRDEASTSSIQDFGFPVSIAWIGTIGRAIQQGTVLGSPGADAAVLGLLGKVNEWLKVPGDDVSSMFFRFHMPSNIGVPKDRNSWPHWSSLLRQIADRLSQRSDVAAEIVDGWRKWADTLEHPTDTGQAKPRGRRRRPRRPSTEGEKSL